MEELLRPALQQARRGLAEGGIPIGAALVHGGDVVATGRNRRLQQGSAVLHAELDALEHAGRRDAGFYRACTLVTTLSPCPMCSGAVLLYGIRRVVIGENRTYRGAEDLLREAGVKLTVVDSSECRQLLDEFIRRSPSLWYEDIGRPSE